MEKRCNRKVQRDKYEKNAPEIRNWWYQLFDIMEHDASIAPDKRLSLLKEVFPQGILDRIMSILSVQKEKYKIEEGSDTEGIKIEVKDTKQRYGSDASLDTERSICDDEEIMLIAKDVESEISVKSATIIAVEEAPAPLDIHQPAPYLNFFKRRPDRTAIWRELPPLLLNEMSLIQKAQAITEAIARDFVSWIKTLGGDEESNLSVNGVMEMFEIAMQINSATSLCVQLKEMPAVPEMVAEAMKMPDKSISAMLYREIHRDQRATHVKRRIVAFGRRLPSEMQVRPLKEDVERKWLSCEKVPPRLETMAAVWQGITHLKSTRAFCEYIFMEKPDVIPPKYLVESGMMDPKTMYVKKEESFEKSFDSFGNVSRVTNLLQMT